MEALERRLGSRIQELNKGIEQARSERNQARDEVRRLRERLASVEARPKPAPVDRTALMQEVEDDLAQDLTRLEERLKERGRIVAELTAQVRQARRVGSELLEELARARDSRGDDSNVAALEAELDTLRQTCTRQQADLEAARWRLSNLERDDDEEAADDVTKLEAALTASRRELAELKRQLDDRGGKAAP